MRAVRAGSSQGAARVRGARCGSAARARADLALHPHAVGHERHARPRVRHVVHDNKAFEAHPDPAEDPAARAGHSPTGPQPLFGDEHRRHGLPLVGHRRSAVDYKADLATAGDRGVRSEREPTTRDEGHGVMVPTRRRAAEAARRASAGSWVATG